MLIWLSIMLALLVRVWGAQVAARGSIWGNLAQLAFAASLTFAMATHPGRWAQYVLIFCLLLVLAEFHYQNKEANRTLAQIPDGLIGLIAIYWLAIGPIWAAFGG